MQDVLRSPAVAGTFYPASPRALNALVDRLLSEVVVDKDGRCPKALIVPHAGYVYSGPIAARAFALLAPHGSKIERVVLVGPAHRVAVEGIVSAGATRMRTPLGDVAVDVEALRRIPDISANPTVHALEHSLEVELPFLQKVAPNAKVIPLAASHARAEEVGKALEALWGGPETVIVISSDLSHYLPYAVGRARDAQTAARIVALDAGLHGEEACGAAGINGLLWAARRKDLHVELLDLRSSGDTAGSRGDVVGYGAFALYEEVVQ